MNKLILLRHGQSQWNFENRFTGWKDVPLTDQGKEEAEKAGQLLNKNNVKIDFVFSSVLQRANKTAEIALKQTGLEHLWTGENLNMINNQSLNERDYGDLVGLNKKETAEKFGKEQVHIWRRSYDTPPPNGESLKDVVERVGPYYEQNIQPLINEKKNVIIVAHELIFTKSSLCISSSLPSYPNILFISLLFLPIIFLASDELYAITPMPNFLF